MDNFIIVENYREELENILKKYSLSLDNLQFKDNLNDNNNPFRIAKCFKTEKVIWLLKRVSDEEKNSVIGAIDTRGFTDKTEALKDDRHFLKHTLLHEICHLLFPYSQEDECDFWAFKEMGL